jgi:hypothetical protein
LGRAAARESGPAGLALLGYGEGKVSWADGKMEGSWADGGRKRSGAGPFVFYFSFFPYSFIYFYSNLDIVFELKIQIYFMSLNGCNTTTIQHTIRCLDMLCNN